MPGNVWEDWLRKVENVGFCMRYEAALSKPVESEEQLFKQLGVVPAAHRKILAELFSSQAGSGEQAPQTEPQSCNGPLTPSAHTNVIPPAAQLAALDASMSTVAAPSFIDIRRDPDDGLAYSWEELIKKYSDQPFTEDEVLEYWEHDCVKLQRGGASSSSSPAPLSTKPLTSSSTGFADWLMQVDPSGACRKSYMQAVEDNYDSVDQIEELYVIKAGGERKLDPQFFRDIGIEDERQCRLFQVFFEGAPPAMPGSLGAVPPAAATSPAQRQTLPAGKMTFADWLKAIDPSGSCQRYLADIEENYDNVDQILELYLSDSPAGNGKILDNQLFADIGVSKASHVSLFESWFARQYGLAPRPPVALQPNPEVHDEDVELTIARWLQQVDQGSGAAASFLKVFEENYDDVEQIKDLYAIDKDGKTTCDEQLFEDMGIEDESLKVLFRTWFAAI